MASLFSEISSRNFVWIKSYCNSN